MACDQRKQPPPLAVAEKISRQKLRFQRECWFCISEVTDV